MKNKENIKIDWSSKDNRPRWVIYFDRFLWIITILLVIGFIYKYNYQWYNVTVLNCQGEKMGGGKILNLNLTAFIEENNLILLNESQEKQLKSQNEILNSLLINQTIEIK